MAKKKVVFVTGGSGGIGESICLKLIKSGFYVAIGYKTNKKAANNLTKKNDAIAIQVNVSSRESIKKGIQSCKKFFGQNIDVLINNAAISQEKSFEKISDADWDNMLVSNLRSAFSFSQEVIPHMIKNKWGRIVNVVSISGQWGGRNQIHYAASKAGLINLTTSLAKLYSKNGITVNAVSPGLVKTKMIANELKTTSGKNKIKQIPIGRIASTDEVANVVNFLSSNEASYITGQTINVNGGMYS
jgi:acetoacetyl-CoA reductase/3-oxoacyl-[acyl-carrier protein] reductase